MIKSLRKCEYLNFLAKKTSTTLKLISVAPLALPTSIAVFGVVLMLFLITDNFYPKIIGLIGTVLALITYSVVYKHTKNVARPGSNRERIICDILIVSLVLVWVVFNGLYTSQHIYTDRDPALYSVAGMWLAEHNSLDIPKIDIFGDNPQVASDSRGFGASPVHSDKLFTHGVHMLPAFLGVVGSIFGLSVLFHFNVMFGGMALLALYGFARYLARPRWALIAVASFSLMLPLIHFSRDNYTEPLTAIFVFGALSLLWASLQTKSRALWFLTGITAGAGVLVRIDAYLALAGIAVFLILYNLPKQLVGYKDRLINTSLVLIGILLCIVLGWINITNQADGYYAGQRDKLLPELGLLGFLLMCGVLLVVLRHKTQLLNKLYSFEFKKLPIAAFTIVAAVFAVLASRPLWYESYAMRKVTDPFFGEPTRELLRNYHEMSFSWVTWYAGPIVVIFGVFGLAFAAYLILRNKNLYLLPGFLIIFSISVFYLFKPSIAPDQIWASRRYLPVVIPGLLAFSVLVLDFLHRQKKTQKFGVSGETITAITVVIMLITPLYISQPFMTTRTHVPQLTQINEICNSLEADSAVVWIGRSGLTAVQPTRAVCDVPSVRYIGELKEQKIRKLAETANKKGHQLVLGVYAGDKKLIPKVIQQEMELVSSINTKDLNKSNTAPPRHIVSKTKEVFLGQINNDRQDM